MAALSKWRHDSLLNKIPGLEVQIIDEDHAHIIDVGDGGGEETFRIHDAPIVPFLLPGPGAFQVAGMDWSSCPADGFRVQGTIFPAEVDRLLKLLFGNNIRVFHCTSRSFSMRFKGIDD